MVVLDEATVGSVIQMSALIPAMEEALTALSAGTVIQPTRLTMPVAEHDATLRSMPACTGAELGAKLVTVFPLNEHVPTHHAVVVLFRPETGEPLAVMDGRLITEMRTAAVSAVATKLLARSDAHVLAILGSGVQARSHLQALRLVRNFREVRMWSPRNAAAFAQRFGVQLAGSAEEAVCGADVVVAATSSHAPALRGK